jgi:SAM-dependent methyltransferase
MSDKARTSVDANVERWAAEDDAWRGYKRQGGRLVLEDRVARTLDLVVPRAGASYLDIGCGPGVITKLIGSRIGAARVIGVDQLEVARKEGDLELVPCNLDPCERLPFDDATFDVVSCLETLEHVHDTDHLVTEIRRVLKPDGYALISVPRLDGLLSIALLAAGMTPPAVECSLQRRYGAPGEPSRVSGHVSHFTRRALESLLKANGFAIERFAQASIYSGWLLAQEKPSPWIRVPLWLFSRVPFKQDDLIVRVRRRA